MPRTARAVAIGYPHHITQRGNNREPVFFDDSDRFVYLAALSHYSQQYNIELWAYCLMPNHVHLLAVPHTPNGLALGIGRTNLKYTRYLNHKHFRSGRIWQNRFYSSIVDTDCHLWAVARYIENNPVKAGLTKTASDYPWSSARHHLGEKENSLLESSTWLNPKDRSDYRHFLSEKDDKMTRMIAKATISGRAICASASLSKLEKQLGRSL